MEPLVSVVTPFHDTREFLGECIESVLAQSYRNFEYILLNNASTDGGDEVAAEYARRDPRIKLLHTEALLPQVPNYNRALTLISPESAYCKIVQADDWIFDDCLTRMVALAEENPSVGIVSGYTLAGTLVWNTGLPYDLRVLEGADVARRMLLKGEFYFGSPTSVLFRSQVVREQDTVLLNGGDHEDTMACYEILRTWDFGFVHRMLSYVRTNNPSILAGVRGLDPGLLERHIMVGAFGQDYLKADEYAATLERTRRACLRQLGRLWLRGNRRELWRHYRRELASIGYELRAGTLFGVVVTEILDKIFNPKRTLGGLMRRLRQTDTQSPNGFST